MLKLLFRIAFIALGGAFLWWGGSGLYKPVQYHLSGVRVEGRVEGFWAGRGTQSVQPEDSGVRKGRRKARRPAYRYPSAVGSADSLTGRNSAPQFFQGYSLGDRVEVVFPAGHPEDAWLYDSRELGGWILILLGGLVILAMGLFPKIW